MIYGHTKQWKRNTTLYRALIRLTALAISSKSLRKIEAAEDAPGHQMFAECHDSHEISNMLDTVEWLSVASMGRTPDMLVEAGRASGG